MIYQPTAIPDGGSLRSWLAAQLRQIADALAAPSVSVLDLVPRAAPPARYRDGNIVFADGTNWDPGAGAGVYARESGAWVKL